MPTVKGPIKLSAGGAIPDAIKEVIGEIRLPFTAKTFKCSNKQLEGKTMRFSDGTPVKLEKGELRHKSFVEKLLGK